MTALDVVSTWDVPNVAATVFTSTGPVESFGDDDKMFPLASVSKVLAAVAVHIAIEEGSITLDDQAGTPGSTARHLLSHASGLSPDDENESLADPGRRRIYSNAGFEMLARHLTEATTMPYGDYARMAVVEPLGLEQIDLNGSPAHGHHASVADLRTVLSSVVNHELLADDTVNAMTTPAFPELTGVLPGYGRQDPNPWGLGVEIRGDKQPHWTSPLNSPRTWGHFGRSGTFVWFDPQVELGLIVLTDRDFGPWAIEAWPPLSTAVLEEHT